MEKEPGDQAARKAVAKRLKEMSMEEKDIKKTTGLRLGKIWEL